MENTKELKLESDTFEMLRVQFDSLLQLLVDKMERANAEEGKITVSCDVKIVEMFADDGTLYKHPSFDWDVQTTVQEKMKRSGGIFGDLQITFDEETKTYVLSEPPTAQEKMEEAV